MSRSSGLRGNQLWQLVLAHGRESLRDRRGMTTLLIVFGGLLLGLLLLDLLIAWNGGTVTPGAAVGSGVLASSLPLVALIGFSSLGLVSTAVPLVAYRANGVLRHLSTTPVSRGYFIVAHAPVRLGLGFLQTVLLLILAVFFAAPTSADLVRAAVLMLSAMAAFIALGYLVGAQAHDPDRALNLSYMLTILILATSGTTIPLAPLPNVLSSIFGWLPTTLFAQELSAELLDLEPPWLSFWAVVSLLLGIAAVLMTLSSRILRWDVHQGS